jgi:hypothetical protein
VGAGVRAGYEAGDLVSVVEVEAASGPETEYEP